MGHATRIKAIGFKGRAGGRRCMFIDFMGVYTIAGKIALYGL